MEASICIELLLENRQRRRPEIEQHVQEKSEAEMLELQGCQGEGVGLKSHRKRRAINGIMKRLDGKVRIPESVHNSKADSSQMQQSHCHPAKGSKRNQLTKRIQLINGPTKSILAEARTLHHNT